MIRTLKCILLLAAIAGLAQAAAAHGSAVPSSGSSPDSSSNSSSMSKADMAKVSYNSGIGHKDKAKQLEEQINKQSFKDAKEIDKYAAKIKDEYAKALKDFKNATEQDPTLFQAFNGLAFALRKTGDAAKALEMYDKALQMAPGFFPDAIEYRGEAYLALGRVDDAKQAYMSLFGKDRIQAGELMKAMNSWLAKPSAGLDPEKVSAFGAWLKEREKIANTTEAMGIKTTSSIWK